MDKMLKRLQNDPIKYVKIFAWVYFVSSFLYNAVASFQPYIYAEVWPSQVVLLQVMHNYAIGSIPFVLFLVYIHLFYQKNQKHILLIFSFIATVLLSIYNYAEIADLRRYFDATTFFWNHKLPLLVGLVPSVIYLVSSASGFKFLKVARCTSVVCAIFNLVRALGSIFTTSWQSFELTLFIVVLSVVFTVASGLTSVVFWNCAVRRDCVSKTEKALIKLKKQLESGAITEEEYNAQKAKILNKF